MKIHFIYADVNTYYYPGVHHGVAYILGVLKMDGHVTSMHHVKKEPSKKAIRDMVKKENPDLIAFSAVTNQIEYVDKWSTWIKQEFAIPTICGGIHATLFPEQVIDFEGIDMVCLGEGEYPMLELANDLARTDIMNLWFKRDSSIIKNPLRPLISPLDDLPYPDYSLFNPKKMLQDRNGDFAILASRGCPFSCTYCCNHALRELYKGNGKYFRLRSVDNVLTQLELLMDEYSIRHLSFADDVFGLSRAWAIEFCEKYPRKFNLEFECNARADTLDEDLLERLKGAGCTQINMGVEAGNEWIRREVLQRKMSNEQIIKAFDSAHRLGLKTLAYNMIGLPYETREMIQETINLNKRIAPSRVAMFFFFPYPGTELYKTCKKEGFLSQKSSTNYISGSILQLPTITPEELQKAGGEFYRYAIDRRIQPRHPLIRYPLKAITFVLIKLFGMHGVEALMKGYLRFFRIFSFLENKNRKDYSKLGVKQ